MDHDRLAIPLPATKNDHRPAGAELTARPSAVCVEALVDLDRTPPELAEMDPRERRFYARAGCVPLRGAGDDRVYVAADPGHARSRLAAWLNRPPEKVQVAAAAGGQIRAALLERFGPA
ncbi:MAG: hypothetical protein AAGL49_04820, partial [Pseudomonadota bacterium]